MKHFCFSILIIIVYGSVFSQQLPESDKDFAMHELTDMYIFPGCEEFGSDQKKEVSDCMRQKIEKLLLDKIDDFFYVLEEFNSEKASCKFQFVIDKNGKIINSKALPDNNYLSILLGFKTEEAMNLIAEEIPKIKPAMVGENQPVNIVLRMPITYSIDQLKHPNPSTDFDFNELVYRTLKSEKETYEIRMENETSKIKVYEVSEGKVVYLGQFNTIEEVCSA